MDINSVSMSSNQMSNEGFVPRQSTSNYQSGSMTGYSSQEASESSDSSSSMERIIGAIEHANNIQTGTTECQFSIHKDTKQIMIKIIDAQTKEVIKEIPSEKILDMVANMCEVAGLFVDTKK